MPSAGDVEGRGRSKEGKLERVKEAGDCDISCIDVSVSEARFLAMVFKDAAEQSSGL
jgi:hypothetical protein